VNNVLINGQTKEDDEKQRIKDGKKRGGLRNAS
jgi:hypothetical protein